MPFDLSMGEFLLILFVALLVFGGKLPETARKVGHALSEFKRGMREELRKVEEGVRHDSATPEWRPPKDAQAAEQAPVPTPEPATEPTPEQPGEPAAAQTPEPPAEQAAGPTRRDP